MAIYDASFAAGIETGDLSGATFFNGKGHFVISELGLQWTSLLGGSGRLAAGPWFHTADLDRFSGGTKSGTVGFYALLEQSLWAENPELEEAFDDQGITAFLQYGWADEAVSETAQHLGVGLVWTGALPTRDIDALGLMVSWVDLSKDAGFDKNETLIEFFYLFRPVNSVGLKFDLQYIANPGGQGGVSDVVVGTLRTEITF